MYRLVTSHRLMSPNRFSLAYRLFTRLQVTWFWQLSNSCEDQMMSLKRLEAKLPITPYLKYYRNSAFIRCSPNSLLLRMQTYRLQNYWESPKEFSSWIYSKSEIIDLYCMPLSELVRNLAIMSQRVLILFSYRLMSYMLLELSINPFNQIHIFITVFRLEDSPSTTLSFSLLSSRQQLSRVTIDSKSTFKLSIKAFSKICTLSSLWIFFCLILMYSQRILKASGYNDWSSRQAVIVSSRMDQNLALLIQVMIVSAGLCWILQQPDRFYFQLQVFKERRSVLARSLSLKLLFCPLFLRMFSSLSSEPVADPCPPIMTILSRMISPTVQECLAPFWMQILRLWASESTSLCLCEERQSMSLRRGPFLNIFYFSPAQLLSSCRYRYYLEAEGNP